MCGIVGILGTHEVAPQLVEALRRLEYRGYDSAGIATVHDGHLDRRRAMGKLVNLSDALVHHPLAGKSGIGHTRWATHGEPSTDNAHPHKSGPVAVVHNGIIENYKELRAEVKSSGLEPATETDTETIALLTHSLMQKGLSPVDAAMTCIDKLEGAFALAFLFDGEEDLMVAARKGSPLAIGHGEGEMFVGSDAIALAPLTPRITYLEEGDRAVLTREGVTIRDEAGRLVVTDRLKDVIITGGENVSSREVEDVLSRHGGVEQVAVVGVPDPYWGESICAVVVPRGSVHADELITHVRTRLAAFKRPRHVLFVAELPLTSNGKVAKDAVRRYARAAV